MAYLSRSSDNLITQVRSDTRNQTHCAVSNSHSLTSQPPRRNCAKKLYCSPKYMFIATKSVIAILLWTILVGSIYSFALFVAPPLMLFISPEKELYVLAMAFAFLALILMVYPFGGLLGDVCLGRYRMVLFGLCLLFLCVVAASVDAILLFSYDGIQNITQNSLGSFIAIAIIILSAVFLVAGFSAFNSNIVQLGLDQLMEEPSESLGVFVHWFVWSTRLGKFIILLLFAAWHVQCPRVDLVVGHVPIISATLPMVFTLILIVFLFVNCCTFKRFNTERVRYNPYKMILKVLNFARKNKYPVGPTTAFAYCDDTRPSRIDYAKERYGGPFTTSDVEDVKTFIRVLLVLLAIGPVFILDVPTSYFLFPAFALHTGQEISFNNETCGWKWMLLESGTLYNLSTVVILPLYVWIVYCVLRNRIPKILFRLGFAVCLYIISVMSMLIVDLTGHIVLQAEQKPNAMCMFVEPVFENKSLHLHWSVLILSNILLDLSPDLIMASAFEFISAQSPYTMKGVLVGMLFAIRGLFRVVGIVLLFPFALDQIWNRGHLRYDPPVTSCAFGYYLVTIVVALVGLCLLFIAVKKYKYRKREDEPFSQAQVEEIFYRRIQQEQSMSITRRMNRLSADHDCTEEDRLLHIRRPLQ